LIPFFRKIRKSLVNEDKFVKYSKYAIGEIILVVFGILIALQVNNWNERRNEQGKIKKYALSLAQDLENDVKMVDTIQYIAKQIALRIDSLSNYTRNKEINEISNLDVFCLSWMKLYRPYSWNRATLDELKNSGSLQLIKNNELSKKIVEYDALTLHMDEDYNEDNIQSNNAWLLISEVVNVNYPNITQLREVIRFSANYGTLKDIFLSPEYMEMKTYNLDLNTKDKEAIVSAVNNYIMLQFNIEIRTVIELPKLVADAKELISLLKKEYPE